MARPKADFPPPEAIKALADSEGRLRARVTPGARNEGIALGDGLVIIKVRAKPQDGKANEAVLAILAEALGVAPTRLELLRGTTARDKLVRIEF